MPEPQAASWERLGEAEVPAKMLDAGATPARGQVAVLRGSLHDGLVLAGDDSTPGMVIVTESDLTGNRVAAVGDGKRLPAKRRNQVDPLALSAGDMVVHDQHGIGRFVEMVERTIGGARREYLVIEYAPSKRGHPGDRLFVPMESLDQLSRYVGGELPALSKLGGSDWANTKRKARKAVREIAGELVQLYAARQAAPGHAFGPDTPWQKELEDAFAFTETIDQLTVISEVKADMEKPVPMDRVVIGDVGYGKDGDRRPRRVQGSAGRQASGGAGADDSACTATSSDLHRTNGVVPGKGARAVPVHRRQGLEGNHRRHGGR